jgi:hypothetical protein
MKTVVGLFSSVAQAEQVKQALIAEDYSAKVIANGSSLEGGEAEGIGQKISNFFHDLTGGDEGVHDHYATGVNTGGALVGVTVEDDEASEVADLLRQHGAREVQGKSASEPQAGYATPEPISTAGRLQSRSSKKSFRLASAKWIAAEFGSTRTSSKRL